MFLTTSESSDAMSYKAEAALLDGDTLEIVSGQTLKVLGTTRTRGPRLMPVLMP